MESICMWPTIEIESTVDGKKRPHFARVIELYEKEGLSFAKVNTTAGSFFNERDVEIKDAPDGRYITLWGRQFRFDDAVWL